MISELERLKKWFISQKRDLPWRNQATPYAVWVSEVMLQQTQVTVVIPYFYQWMESFPTIQALAEAPIEDVIKRWEGLGYYSRARNLHEGARYLVQNHDGKLPNTAHELHKIKGLGAYTVGAILSFAFHQKMAAVDGNVLRVFSRYYGLFDDISKAKTVKNFRERVQNILPENEPWLISEALIELGATVCSRNPNCHECPLKTSCRAFLEDKIKELPFKSSKIVTKSLFRVVAVIICDNHILLCRGEKGKVMADLFEFPYFEVPVADMPLHHQLEVINNKIKFPIKWQQTLPTVQHSFTRYCVLLTPQLFKARELTNVEGYSWHSLDSVKKLPFSSGHRRILNQLT